jgi:hypothetical protein
MGQIIELDKPVSREQVERLQAEMSAMPQAELVFVPTVPDHRDHGHTDADSNI